MIKHRIVTDLSECRLLWERFIPHETVWDRWNVRACFHQHFQRPVCFIEAEDGLGGTGFLPLCWIEEAGCYQYFPGESWNYKTWIEQNRIVASNEVMVEALLNACPGPYHLRYLAPHPACPIIQRTVDEISYRFLPPQYGYEMQAYFREFSGKSIKRLKKELAEIESAGVEYGYNVLPDFDRMVALNIDRFGEHSYFYDPRFRESFRSLLQLSQEQGWLRLTSVRLGGELAAIDLGVACNGMYTLMAGGTHAGHPGVAKLINLHHMQRACDERYQAADFLSGDFSWKKLFHLAASPLYLVSNAPRFAQDPRHSTILSPDGVAGAPPSNSESQVGGVSSREAGQSTNSLTPFPTDGVAGAPTSIPGAPRESRTRPASANRVLVVGTTSDYIDLIGRRFPDRVIFATDPAERARAKEPAPAAPCEVLFDLGQPELGLDRIRAHLSQHGLNLSGVACFDCECMALASFLARAFDLPYPSQEAVIACRSKYISKQRWRQAGLQCPAARPVERAEQAEAFIEQCRNRKAILKPLTGAGSELIFICRTSAECANAFEVMQKRLKSADARMYASYEDDGQLIDPRRTILAEEFIEGTEYSCDFIIENDSIRVIRIARKWPKTELAPGTILAYELPETVPPGMTQTAFEGQLRAAAQAVGIRRALCMIDFIMDPGRMVLLEIAPRPGGDCLPPLILSSSGLDILELTLDFAEQQPFTIPPASQWQPRVGLRFFTARSGVIAAIDAAGVRRDPRVLDVELKRQPGHRVLQPPDNFDSRLLGHAIFQPSAPETIAEECRDIESKLTLEFTAE